MKKLNLNTTFLLCFMFYVLFSVHIISPTPGGSGLYITPNIVSWVFVCFFIVIALLLIIKQKVFQTFSYSRFIWLGFLLLAIPITYNNAIPSEAIIRVLGLFGGILFLFSLNQPNLNKHRFLCVLLTGIAIEAIIGLVQLFILDLYNIEFLGYRPLNGRPYGSFMQPNVMSSFMATGIALSLYLFNTSYKNETEQKSHLFSVLIYFCLLSCSLLLITLQSKTGYLAALLVLLLFCPTFIRHFKTYRLPLMFITVGVFLGMLTFSSTQSIDRGEQLYTDKSRAEIYTVSTKLFLEAPLVGQGYGRFSRSYIEFESEHGGRDSYTANKDGELYHPHNEILLWAVEGGVLSIAGLLCFCFVYLRLFVKKSLKICLPIIALITPILVHTQTEYPFYHSALHLVYFLIFIWVAQVELDKKMQFKIRSNFIAKLFIILMLLLPIPFLITTLHTSIKMNEFKQSGYANSGAFNSIINPLAWHDYIAVVIHFNELVYAMQNNNQEALKSHILWGNEFVTRKPSIKIYKNLLIALEALEDLGGSVDLDIKNQIEKDAYRFFKLSRSSSAIDVNQEK
jgi:O-antigen polymerase